MHFPDNFQNHFMKMMKAQFTLYILCISHTVHFSNTIEKTFSEYVSYYLWP